MRNLFIIIIIGGLSYLPSAIAANGSVFDYGFEISLDTSELDGLSLGQAPDPGDPELDRLKEQELELEFDLEYTVNEQVYLFFIGALIEESERIEPDGEDEEISGLERKEIGVAVLFGDTVESELTIGRVEFASASEWWLWWDEELDSIRLESGFGNFESVVGVAEEQARESTAVDRIDPELDGVRHIIASLAWELAPDQSLIFYYLDQDDGSSAFNVGEFEDFEKIDEEDADLTWYGISYLGEFDIERFGELEVELHYALVDGDETLYEFDDPDPVTDLAEVTDRERNDVDGYATSFLLGWSPAALDDWSFVLGQARGSGDSNPNDNRDKAFRQNLLQGESSVYGELFEPEISNLRVNMIGVEWEVHENVEIGLFAFDYAQLEAADELRDSSLEVDPEGLDRDLGSEIDLVVTIAPYTGLELQLILAEFEAGKAYGSLDGETAGFVSFELTYEF